MDSKLIDEMIERNWAIPLDRIDLGRNYGSFIKIGIISSTTGYFINRNNEPTEVTSEEFYNENRIVVPASKWRGAERSFILSILRKADLIPQGYYRNMVKKREYLKNIASFLWGDSSTGKNEETAGISSRSFYDWSYSFEPIANITLDLQHNTLGDDGTILKESDDRKTVAANALYSIKYIKPGVKFIRYVTLENVSPEMIILQLMAILGTTRYGARTAILGDNMMNKIVALAGSKGETTVSTYNTMKKAWESGKYEPEALILDSMKQNYERVIADNELHELLNLVVKTMSSKDELMNMFKPLQEKINDQWKEFFEGK